MNINKKKILTLSAIFACISLSGCANKSPSLLYGDFGVSLDQPASSLTVSGYNDDYTVMTIIPSHPSSLFSKYSVNVDKETKNVTKIVAISSVKSDETCQEKKSKIFNQYKQKYNGQFRTSGSLNKDTQFIGFDNSTIQFSCNSDVVVSYSLR